VRALLALALAATAGCGGGGSVYYPAGGDFATPGGGGGNDMAMVAARPDLAPPPDLTPAPPSPDLTMVGPVDPKDPGVQCGNQTCPMGQVCCGPVGGQGKDFTCSANCPQNNISLACDGPEDCGNGTPLCCAQLVLTGSGNNCQTQSAKATCVADCPTAIAACPTTEVVRFCHVGADCADDQQNPNCCELSQGGGGAAVTACISDLIKGFINPNCF
jgi:hypothetical protein